MSGHTPGPWAFNTETGTVQTPSRAIAYASMGSREEEAFANGRLLATAPDLLKALRELCGNADVARSLMVDPGGVVSSALWDTISEAQAAIARATGDA